MPMKKGKPNSGGGKPHLNRIKAGKPSRVKLRDEAVAKELFHKGTNNNTNKEKKQWLAHLFL